MNKIFEVDMKVFKYKKFEILIDEEKTAQYYANFEVEQNQKNRNFQKYAEEKMTDEERKIFASLSIDPEKISVEYALYSKKEKWTAIINTTITGEFVSYPEFDLITLDDVAEKGIEILDDIESNDIIAGHFKFHICTPDNPFDNTDDNQNEIKISISVNGLPWLLDEKCDHILKKKSRFIKLLGKHFPELGMFLLKVIYYIPNKINSYKQK